MQPQEDYYQTYHSLHQQYFQDRIPIQELLKNLETFLVYRIIKNITLPQPPYLIICNHPILEEGLGLDTEYLSYSKGYNYLENDILWYPSIREMLNQKTIATKLITIIRPIGYDIALQELNCLLLPKSAGVTYISNWLSQNSNISCLIYPEGGFNKLQSSFHNGFYHIANNTKLYPNLVFLIVDPILGLNQRNQIVIKKIETIPFDIFPDELHDWIKWIQNWYIHETRTLYEEFNIA